MMYLDTSICVEFLRNRMPSFYAALQRSDPRTFAIPSVVVGELYLGVEKSNYPEKGRLSVDRFLAPFETVDYDERCARIYAQIRAALEKKGSSIGSNDLLIAATALANGAVLVTRNDREFTRVPGLKVEYWDEIRESL